MSRHEYGSGIVDAEAGGSITTADERAPVYSVAKWLIAAFGVSAAVGYMTQPTHQSGNASTVLASNSNMQSKAKEASTDDSTSHGGETDDYDDDDADDTVDGGNLDLDDDDPYLTTTDDCDFNCGDWSDNLTIPEEVYSKDGVLKYTIKVRKARYTGPLSYNTRSYSDNGFPGPTLYVQPGDKVRLSLKNDLEFPTQSDIAWEGYEYDLATALAACEPYTQPNMTSLHFHGMLISINKKGDSPYRICSPQEEIQYEFSIPTDHPSGTYFYHPHGDGSHSVQIMGLMAGVFIVGDTTNEDDDDAYSAVDDQDVGEDTLVTTRTGNKVTVAEKKNIDATTESLRGLADVPMVIQWQAIEATFKNYDFVSRCSHSSMPVHQVAYEGATGYDFALVNGWYKPQHTMLKNVYERWRLINAMSHRYLGFKIPDECTAYSIASDGVYYKAARAQSYVALSLGARMDLLIKCSETVKLASDEPDGLTDNEFTHIFGTDPGFYQHHWMQIHVADSDSEDPEQAAKVAASEAIEKRIAEGSFLLDHGYFGMDLTEGSDEEWAMKSMGEYVPKDDGDMWNTAAFYNPYLSDGINTITEWYTMNGKEYNSRISRRLRYEELQIWNVSHKPYTIMGHHKNHNWHLHSYHFQVMKMYDDRGREWLESPMLDWKAGDWRDTVSIPANGTIFIRFKPIQFTGLVLHHCHIYNHETAGLKEMLAVVDCRGPTIAKMKEKVCADLDDDIQRRLRLTGPPGAKPRVLSDIGSPDGTYGSESRGEAWPWVQQDTILQCEMTIDYICSDSGMHMAYDEDYDREFTRQ